MLGVFFLGENSWVTGGFQQVTDRMASRLGDKAHYSTEVTRVEQLDGLVRVTFVQDGEERVATAPSAAVTTSATVVPRIVPDLPDNRRDAFERVKYGPLTMVSLVLERDVPWDRFFAMGSEDTVFQMVVDQTFDTPAGDNPNNPVVCNFIISQYPDETTEIERFAAMSDNDIVEQTLADFMRAVPNTDDADELLIDTKVTRFPVGEIELSPEFYTELLPHIAKPFGNIHFAGDYTHPLSFVDGAVLSAFATARELGGDLIGPDDDRLVRLSARLFKR